MSGEFTYGGGEAKMEALGKRAEEGAARAEAEGKVAGACPIASMCTPPEGELTESGEPIVVDEFAQPTKEGNAQPTAHVVMGAAGLGYWWVARHWAWCSHHPWAYYHVQSVYGSCQTAYKLGHPGDDEFGKLAAKCVFGAASYGFVGKAIDAVKVTVAGAVISCALGIFAP